LKPLPLKLSVRNKSLHIRFSNTLFNKDNSKHHFEQIKDTLNEKGRLQYIIHVRLNTAITPHAVPNCNNLKFFKINFWIPKIPPIQPTSFGKYVKKPRTESNFLKES